MPRPGPWPYECVRRAWHSERHQPIRGSLIKEILRIAHEVHSPSTKKNKEWQEKLPIVVLKAEEIIYSKANSEAEYMDPTTLWERVNDAIDTIIRRDDSDETGGFLQPGIEAALNSGCIAKKASRSQRNTNPRFYLGSYGLGRDNGPLKPTASRLASQFPNFLNPTMPTSQIPVKDPQQNCDVRLLSGDVNMLLLPPSLYSSSYSPYHPTRYGTHPGFVDLPIMKSTPSFVNDWMLENASPSDKDLSTMMIEEYPPEEVMCDLSLRLAPLSVSAPENETRKRRAMEVVEDQQFFWQPKLLCTYSAGLSRIAGLQNPFM